MALIQLPGGLWAPAAPTVLHTSHTLRASTVIDATGEKFAQMGRVWYPDRATTRSIVRVHQRFGPIVKAGGSALKISLQGISAAANAPLQPNGTPAETVAIANADAGFASNLWYRSGALSAARTVAYGEPLAVVTEFDAAGRLGADSVTLGGLRGATISGHLGSGNQLNSLALYTASWGSADQTMSNCILEFSDGTFGSFVESWPCSNAGTLVYTTASAADENALRFRFPVEVQIDAAWLSCGLLSAAAAAEVILYEGTTARRTVALTPYHFATFGTTSMQPLTVPFEPFTIAANTTYYLAFKPTAAVNVYLNYVDVDNAAHWQAHPWGAEWFLASRVDGGAWNETATTRRPLIGLRISAIHNGIGGGAAPSPFVY